MWKIDIQEEVETQEEFIYVMKEISKHIERGNTSGIDPTWSFEEVQDE